MNINGNIIYAEYGTNDKYINVTEQVIKHFLKNNTIHIPIKCNFNLYFGDPIKNKKKRLLIKVNDEQNFIPEQNGKVLNININTNKISDKTKTIIPTKENVNKKIQENISENIPDKPIDKPTRKFIGTAVVKYVNELRNKHRGKDIYVICSGKSCDFIDPSFFKNKITIGVNQVYRKFQTTYLVRKENNYFKKVLEESHPNTIHCVTEGNCGGNDTKNVDNYINDNSLHNKKNIYFIKHMKNMHKVGFPNNDHQLAVSYSTSTTAVHLAAFLGAANILLVGHDCGAINGQTNFNGYYKDIKCIPGKGYDKWLVQVSDDINVLKKWLYEKYGCNVYSINPFTNLRLDGNKFM